MQPEWHLIIQSQQWKQQMCEICSNLTIGVFIVNSGQISIFPLLILNKKNVG